MASGRVYRMESGEWKYKGFLTETVTDQALEQTIKRGGLTKKAILDIVASEDPLNRPRFSSSFGQPTFEWAGRSWFRRDTDWKSGGPNASDHWARGNIQAEGSGLRFSLTNAGGDPVGAELVSQDALGYGTYEVTFSADFDQWDKHAVFGMFTFQWAEPQTPGHRELDAIEVSKWGQDGPMLGKFTYYPNDDGVSAPDFQWPSDLKKATVRMRWTDGRLEWTLINAETGKQLFTHVKTDRVPAPDKQQVHINVWAFGSSRVTDWGSAQPFSVLVEDFVFSPAQLPGGAPTLPPTGGISARLDPSQPGVLVLSDDPAGTARLRVDPSDEGVLIVDGVI